MINMFDDFRPVHGRELALLHILACEAVAFEKLAGFIVAATLLHLKAIGEEVQKRCGDNEACQLLEGDRLTRQYVEQGKLPPVDWTKIIEHIDHAVRVAGVDHVGLGSDFDGANMPYGMEDATKLPKITDALLKKGHSGGDVKKILGENTLRVMAEVERVSREMSKR